jgi:hypothetical protein
VDGQAQFFVSAQQPATGYPGNIRERFAGWFLVWWKLAPFLFEPSGRCSRQGLSTYLEQFPDEVSEKRKHQEQECAYPDQKMQRQLWGLNLFFIHVKFYPERAVPALFLQE